MNDTGEAQRREGHAERERSCGSEKKMVHLPNDLVTLILLRLPVKSLIRFKCVSKSWFSLISLPHFAISHFELAAASTHRLLYLPTISYASQTLSIDLDASSLHTPFSCTPLNPSFLPSDSFIDIKGSCRGFILLKHSFSNFELWNPSTAVHKPISSSPIVESNGEALSLSPNANFALNFTIFYGFGYDPSTDDYLVVLGSYNLAVGMKIYFEFFSLRANVWNKIEGAHLPASKGSRTGTLLNEVIHWLAFRNGVGVVILTFDLTERSFSDMPLPTCFDPGHDVQFSDVCVLGGFLSLYHRTDDLTVEIWVMNDYKVQSSWTKSVVVNISNFYLECFSPIWSSESGDIVGNNDGEGLVKVNAKGQLLEERLFHDVPHVCKAAMAIYTESLLSLPIDYGQAAEDVGDDEA